jgi:hypothetical protein
MVDNGYCLAGCQYGFSGDIELAQSGSVDGFDVYTVVNAYMALAIMSSTTSLVQDVIGLAETCLMVDQLTPAYILSRILNVSSSV